MEGEGQGARDLPQALVSGPAKLTSRSLSGRSTRPSAQCGKPQKESFLPVENRLECSRLRNLGSDLDAGQLKGQQPWLPPRCPLALTPLPSSAFRSLFPSASQGHSAALRSPQSRCARDHRAASGEAKQTLHTHTHARTRTHEHTGHRSSVGLACAASLLELSGPSTCSLTSHCS